ncbi:exopolysaccharide biosynthesis protein [Poseidonocella sp. HB161398]|uniref:exopolysaccharide biosynthesis protein n=1 Tax=Poseidonocella sp. HB161398 TaxID=2320855 RepID=UPI0011097DD3|nr:exopolysaccharide biosynthesis protein [Poseidonocella sp. HB161398]
MAQDGEQTGPGALPDLVARIGDLAEGREEIPLARLVEEIGARGHAPLLMIVAVLMVLPLGMIPGIGGALGALAALIGLQMLRGRRGLWLPDFLGRRTLPAAQLARMAERMQPAAAWLGRHLHVRLQVLSAGRLSLSLIALVLILAGSSLLVLGAIPVATPLLGVPVAIFAIGILSRDGAVVAAGWAVLALAVSTLGTVPGELAG